MSSKLIAFTLVILSPLLTKGQLGNLDKVSIHGYSDMVLLTAKVPNFNTFTFIDVHRLNFQPEFQISDKISTTMLIEAMDLFTLDETDAEEEPGIAEWVYIDYKVSEALNVRVGRFPLPFGIHNESFYATPTQLTSFLPYSLYSKHEFGEGAAAYEDFAFARNPNGIRLSGKFWDSDKWRSGYKVYFGNEPIGSSALNINKYMGGRLEIRTKSSNKFAFGASYCGYLEQKVFTKNTFGLDLQIRHKGLQFDAEAILPIMPQRDTLTTLALEGRYHGVGYYGQIGYTVKDIVTPYLRYDYFNYQSKVQSTGIANIVAGINVAVHAQIIWKNEVYFFSPENTNEQNYTFFISTLAVAF